MMTMTTMTIMMMLVRMVLRTKMFAMVAMMKTMTMTMMAGQLKLAAVLFQNHSGETNDQKGRMENVDLP